MCLRGMLAAGYDTLSEPMQQAAIEFFDVNAAWSLDSGLLPRTLGVDDRPGQHGGQQAGDAQADHHIDHRRADLALHAAFQGERQDHGGNGEETDDPPEEHLRPRRDHRQQVGESGRRQGEYESRQAYWTANESVTRSSGGSTSFTSNRLRQTSTPTLATNAATTVVASPPPHSRGGVDHDPLARNTVPEC